MQAGLANTAPQWSPASVPLCSGDWADHWTGGGENPGSRSVHQAGGHWRHDRCRSGSGLCCPWGRGSEVHTGPCPGLGSGGPASTRENVGLAQELPGSALCFVATSPVRHMHFFLNHGQEGGDIVLIYTSMPQFMLTRNGHSLCNQLRKPEIYQIQHYDPTHGPHANLTNCPLVSYSLFLPPRAQDPTGHLPPWSLQAPDGHSLQGVDPPTSARHSWPESTVRLRPPAPCTAGFEAQDMPLPQRPRGHPSVKGRLQAAPGKSSFPL